MSKKTGVIVIVIVLIISFLLFVSAIGIEIVSTDILDIENQNVTNIGIDSAVANNTYYSFLNNLTINNRISVYGLLLGFNSTFNKTYDAFEDSNYSTACGIGEHGDGSGECLNTNKTIDDRTASITYNATDIITIDGTLTAGDITSIQIPEDGDTYNVTEGVGADPLTININFTDVVTFDSINGRIRYSGSQGHEVQLEIQRTDTDEWENYLDFTDTTDFVNIHTPVYDPTSHIDATGNVSVRFKHFQSGIPSHEFFIDYLVLVDGFTALTVSDHDSLGGRDNPESNHPWSRFLLHNDSEFNSSGATFYGNVLMDGANQFQLGDSGTYINRVAQGKILINATGGFAPYVAVDVGGFNLLKFAQGGAGGEILLNDAQANFDFTYKSMGDANLIDASATLNRVGIGKFPTANDKFQVAGGISADCIESYYPLSITDNSLPDTPFITWVGGININSTRGYPIGTNSTIESMRINVLDVITCDTGGITLTLKVNKTSSASEITDVLTMQLYKDYKNWTSRYGSMSTLYPLLPFDIDENDEIAFGLTLNSCVSGAPANDLIIDLGMKVRCD